jgi:hypothetical protein
VFALEGFFAMTGNHLIWTTIERGSVGNTVSVAIEARIASSLWPRSSGFKQGCLTCLPVGH